jgi:hypothetical protein
MDGSGWDSEDTVTGICILKNQTVRLSPTNITSSFTLGTQFTQESERETQGTQFTQESERETQQKNRIILDEEVLKSIEKVGSI